MRQQYHDALTGWRFEADAIGSPPAPGGIALTNITHQHFNFARDIRVIGLWLEVHVVDSSGAVLNKRLDFHPLDTGSFSPGNVMELKSQVMPTDLPPIGTSTFRHLRRTNEALQFKKFFDTSNGLTGYGLQAQYTSKASMFAKYPNCEVSGLNVEQIYLCTPYANSPPHEPSGALHAARLLPMFKFKFLPNPNVDRKQVYQLIESIRVDYRLNIKLDRHHNVQTNSQLPNLGNRTGLFKDRESIPAAIGGFLTNLVSISGASFEAVEKPLVAEVMAPGLAKGFNFYQPGPKQPGVVCWDNIHQWGRRPGNKSMISAPGAFHAAHLHWRWGGAVPDSSSQFNPKSRPKAVENALKYLGKKHWPPLVDPRIWIQSIRVAVTENDASVDPAKQPLSKLSTQSFKSLFNRLRAKPKTIYGGADLVTWLSFQVHRTLEIPSVRKGMFERTKRRRYFSQEEGVLFHHGIFFAHEPEQGGATVGQRTGDHRPRSINEIQKKPVWFRPAS